MYGLVSRNCDGPKGLVINGFPYSQYKFTDTLPRAVGFEHLQVGISQSSQVNS